MTSINKNDIFTRLDVGVTVGTSGLGFDLSSNVTRFLRVRAGASFMPHFSVPMEFSLQSYTDEGGVNTGNFDRLQNYMKRLTGIDVDDKVKMDGKMTMANFKFLVDYYPWQDKGWHVTAGFFIGGRKVAKAVNNIAEMPSLLALNIYNNFYNYFMETDFFETPIYGDYYLDPFMVEEIRDNLEKNGIMGIHIGDFKDDGRPYMMRPDSDGMVKANAFVNAFRPYVGLGYTTPLSKDKRFNFDVDLGAMFWGGAPQIITHDGVNLGRDVVNIAGKVGDYIDIVNCLKVCPMLELRVSYTLFK